MFFRIFYNVDSSTRTFIYRNNGTEGVNVCTIQLPKIVVNENVVVTDPKENDLEIQNVASVLQENAMFPESEIYLYQN